MTSITRYLPKRRTVVALVVTSLFATIATRFFADHHQPINSNILNERDDELTNVRRNLQIRRLENPENLDIIWAISYPQTGITSFLEVVHKFTGMTTATNYGNAMYDENGILFTNTHNSIPVFPGRPNGPYLLTKHLPLPPKRILARTHCAGFCLDCIPRDYVLFLTRLDLFLGECLKATRFSARDNEVTTTRYSSDVVGGMVLLLRNPWDILVSRFKHETRVKKSRNEVVYDDGFSGFHAWCASHDANEKMVEQEKEWYQEGEFFYAEPVPCHAEFYRMVKWHNMVFKMAEEMKMPVHVIHIEDLKDNPSVLMELFKFLNMDDNVNPADITPTDVENTYVEFFNQNEKSIAVEFMKKVGRPELLKHWERYMNLVRV